MLKFLGRNAPADETPSHDKAADECLPEVDTRGFDVTKSRELDFLNDHRYPADFVKFLSMFGHEGVVIKEFLMFASLRYPQNDQESGNNDLEASGNPVQKMPEQEESFVTSLVQSIRCREDVDAVRSALVHSIDVIGKQPGHHPGWMVDCQVWVAKSTADHFVPGHIDEKDVQELLRIFGKPTHVGPACVRNRLCEIWYPFARTVCHLLMYHAFSLAKQDQMMSVASVLVTKWVRFNFDVLMYRKEPWDDDLVMANELLARLPDVVVDHWKRWTTLKWMILDIHSEPANQDRFIIEAEVFLESQIHRLEAEMVTSGKPYWMTYGGRRFGRDLLCLLNDAKDLGSERAIAVLRRYGRRFCPSAEAGSGKVYDAICQWFVELEMWEEIAKLPSDHHLDTGFQLSRSGYLIFAEQHLRSGLHTIRNGIQWPLAWRFDLELITVLVRLERWTEVSEHIENVWVVYRRMQSRLPTISMLTGDFPEFSMSLLCLQADMYLTENDLVPAALNLNRALDYGGRMRDPSIQSTCISVRSRLIKAQLNLQQFRYVVTTSLRQIGDLQQLVTRKSTNNPIQPVEEAPNSVPVLTLFQTSRALEVAQRSAVEDLVVCVDELCDHQAFAAASEILRYLPGTTILLKSPLPEYLEQRIAQQKSRIGRKLVERIPHADHMIATTTRANEKGKSVAPFTTTIPSINMQSPSPIQATKVQNIASLEENGQQTMMSLIKNRKARERRHREEQEMTPRIGAGRPRKAWEYKHRKERSRVADDVEQLRLRKGVTNADKGRAALQQTGREPQDQDNSISPLKGYTSEIHATEYLKPLLFFESPSSEISSTLASSSRYQKEKGQSPPSPLFGTSSTYDDPKGLSPPNTLIRLSPTYDEEKGQPSSKTSTGKNITKIPATPQWWHPMPQKMWMRRLLRLKAPSTIPRARVEIQSEKSETQSGETFPTAELTLL